MLPPAPPPWFSIHDALTKDGAEPIGDDASHAVDRAARRERHDKLIGRLG